MFILKAERVIYNLSWKDEQFIYVGNGLFNSSTLKKKFIRTQKGKEKK